MLSKRNQPMHRLAQHFTTAALAFACVENWIQLTAATIVTLGTADEKEGVSRRDRRCGVLRGWRCRRATGPARLPNPIPAPKP
jgi:hypothetical protein